MRNKIISFPKDRLCAIHPEIEKMSIDETLSFLLEMKISYTESKTELERINVELTKKIIQQDKKINILLISLLLTVLFSLTLYIQGIL